MACINAFGASYYVDYSSGADGNSGTSTSSAWQHCPGDPVATSKPASTPLNPGDTVFFKGGVQYVLTGDGNPVYQTGIGLSWSGAAGQPITYDGNSAGTWGTGRAILTDNYSTNHIAAFYNYGGVNNLVFNNLEIGPIGGAPSLPPDPGTGVPSNQGYGIFAYGTMSNVTIQNCYFHDLGYWFNQQPMDANSLGGSDSRISGGGVIFYGASSVVITNCEFTKQHTAIEAAYSVNSSNITIASCFFHDYIIWSIDMAGISGNLDYTYIYGNTFQDVGWAYSPAYWAGYNYIPESCSSCYAGPPHQDGIFHRTGTTNVTNGTHIDIYNNTFDETHLYENYTACIYLEYAPSANIYNNLFNIPNAGIPNNAVPSDPGGGGAPPIVISYELNQGSTLRVLNNTFIINTVDNPQNSAVHWGSCGCLNPPLVWPANAFLQIENNLAYSFYNGADDATIVYPGVITNQYPVSQWTIDYNDWHSQGQADTWFWWNNQPGFNIHGGLAADQSVGFDTHGMTNDPQFVSLAYSSSTNSMGNNYHLQAGSPAIGAGVNLSSLNLPGLNSDKDGTPRPASGPWDIGTYEYNTNSVAPSAPVASFSAAPTNGTAPLAVTFTDTSTGSITNRTWQFGDGTVTNTTATSVVYQYTASGTDTVQLVVSGAGGSSTNVQTNLITIGSTNSVPPPVATFSAAPTNGTAPLTVTFTDTSAGTITNRLWHFGDGTSTNTLNTTIVHQYTTAGTNSVHLNVYGPGGEGIDWQMDLVTVTSTAGNTNIVSPPVASFSATPTSGMAPLTVTFTDTSTGTITNRAWQFGDGNVVNTTATNVIYQYTAPGTDTVQLVVSGPGGSSTNLQANLIMVSSAGNTNNSPAPVAAFHAAPTTGTVPLTVTFTDTSTGTITNRLWSFGDGTSISTLGATVTHLYSAAGTNSVQLVVSGPGGTGVDVQGDLIIVNPSSQSGTNGVPQTAGHSHWRYMAAH